MAVEIINLNGLSPYIDHNSLQVSAEKYFSDPLFETKIVILNNFPLAISSQTAIDLILFIRTENPSDKSKAFKFNDCDFRNLIIPIKIANEESFEGSTKDNLDRELVKDIFKDDINSMNSKLVNYLKDKCGFSELRVEPLVYVKFPELTAEKGVLFADSLSLETIFQYLKTLKYKLFSSNSSWGYGGFDAFLHDVKRVVDQASKDAEYGYLTKKKLDYIARKRMMSDEIFNELGTKTIIINGKAGTGKTLELINMASRVIESGSNILYLTYNTLLVNDVAKTLKHRQNSLIYLRNKIKNNDIEIQIPKIGEATVSTLHHYNFHLVRSLGISLIINADRIQELIYNLKSRTAVISNFLNNNINPAKGLNADHLRTLIQNSPNFTREIKEAGILLVNFLEKKRYNPSYSLSKNVGFFIEDRTKLLINNFQNQVFLSDYHNVLKETLKALRNTDEFYDEYNVESKGELLKEHFNLSDNDTISFSREAFAKKVSKRVVSRLRRRKVFIDEAHDCTQIERDILMTIFKPHNFAVTSGGKEQLIRTGKILEWSIASGNNHAYRIFKKENKTYRMKSNIVHLVNFIARRFNCDINLTADSVEDSGVLTFDFRPTDNVNLKNIISEYKHAGFLAGYSPYETFLFLIDSRTDHRILKEKETDKLVITEDNNISESKGACCTTQIYK